MPVFRLIFGGKSIYYLIMIKIWGRVNSVIAWLQRWQQRLGATGTSGCCDSSPLPLKERLMTSRWKTCQVISGSNNFEEIKRIKTRQSRPNCSSESTTPPQPRSENIPPDSQWDKTPGWKPRLSPTPSGPSSSTLFVIPRKPWTVPSESETVLFGSVLLHSLTGNNERSVLIFRPFPPPAGITSTSFTCVCLPVILPDEPHLCSISILALVGFESAVFSLGIPLWSRGVFNVYFGSAEWLLHFSYKSLLILDPKIAVKLDYGQTEIKFSLELRFVCL